MSVVEEIAAAHGIPVPDISVHEKMINLQTELDRANNTVTFWIERSTEYSRKVDNVAGYLRDCLDMGDSPDVESIADYLDIELKREFTVRQEVTFDFVVTALNEDEAQQIAEGIYYSATGDFDSEDYEVTDTQVEST